MSDEPNPTVLIVDDEKHILSALRRVLEDDYEVRTAGSADEAVAALEEDADVSVIVADNVMPGRRGVELLGEVRQRWPDIVRLLLTGYSSNESVLAAINEGHVFSYVKKPVEADDFKVYVGNAVAYQRAVREQERLRQQLEMSFALRQAEHDTLKRSPRRKSAFPDMVAASRALRDVLELVEEVAPTRAPILLEGETGTGKEVIAKALHRLSHRKPFIAVNCAAIPETILESELFGHEKGAFTGAVRTQIGKFEAADGGTLFLDEVGELPLNLQAKMLRVLQDGIVTRVGSVGGRQVDVRIVAATNRNLHGMIEEGSFRADLYYRLNVLKLEIPPLRERRADIVPLAHQFLERFAGEHGKRVSGISPEAIEALTRYRYPGNVRELSNIIERGVLLSKEETLSPALLPPEVRDAVHAKAERAQVADGPENERAYLESVLEETGGSVAEALRRTQIPRATFYRKLDRLSIDPARFRERARERREDPGT